MYRPHATFNAASNRRQGRRDGWPPTRSHPDYSGGGFDGDNEGLPPFMVSLPTPNGCCPLLQAQIDIGTMSINQEMVMTCVSCLDHSNKVKATIGMRSNEGIMVIAVDLGIPCAGGRNAYGAYKHISRDVSVSSGSFQRPGNYPGDDYGRIRYRFGAVDGPGVFATSGS